MSCDVDVNELPYSINDSQKKVQIKQKYLYVSPLSSLDFSQMMSQ